MDEYTNNENTPLQADGSHEAFLRPQEAVVFGRYAAIIRRLRAPDGCPWDHKQTLRSLRRYIIEESFEALAAINDLTSEQSVQAVEPIPAPSDSTPPVPTEAKAVAEELGDVFLVAMLLSDALEREFEICLEDILVENGEKLVRRHPHVFSTTAVSGPEEVVANWNQIKEQQEGKVNHVDKISSGLPPLERSYEIQKKAAKQGFDWPDVSPVLAKVSEELSELSEAIEGAEDARIEDELGDLLFSVVNVARHLKTDPSVALAGTNEKFLHRFRRVQEVFEGRGLSLGSASLEEMDGAWEEIKASERA